MIRRLPDESVLDGHTNIHVHTYIMHIYFEVSPQDRQGQQDGRQTDGMETLEKS